MATGSAEGVFSRPQVGSPAQSAAAEATETAAVTKQEAAKGDQVAIRKLAKQAAAAVVAEPAPTASSGEPAATAEGKGKEVHAVA